MYNFVKYIVDFFLYSHLFIAICAISICFSTQLFHADHIDFTVKEVFVFFATISLYSLHRIVGIDKILRHVGAGRFQKIRPLKSVLWIIVITGGAISTYIYFFAFDRELQYFLILPTILSLAYVIPFWKGQRMRDIAYIKVFIIAFVWSLVTTVIPLWSIELENTSMNLIIVERFLFILAITIPFDVRDLQIDRQQGVKTLPSAMGVGKVKIVSLAALGLATLLTIFLWYNYDLSTPILVAYIMTYGFTSYLISLAGEDNSDYYFSGWLDATMVILFVLSFGINTAAYYLF